MLKRHGDKAYCYKFHKNLGSFKYQHDNKGNSRNFYDMDKIQMELLSIHRMSMLTLSRDFLGSFSDLYGLF